MDMKLSKVQEIVKDRGAWRTAVHESQRVGHDVMMEQQQQQQHGASSKVPQRPLP